MSMSEYRSKVAYGDWKPRPLRPMWVTQALSRRCVDLVIIQQSGGSAGQSC